MDTRSAAAQIETSGAKVRARNPKQARAAYWYAEDAGGTRIWNAGRKRGLEAVEERLGGALDTVIVGKLLNASPLKIVELGCGYGHALLNLRQRYGERVELCGINVEPWYDQALSRAFAEDMGLADDTLPYPEILIHDADKGLPFGDQSVDILFSIATIHSIRDKLKLLEEVNRVLSEGGVAVLDMCLAAAGEVQLDMRDVPIAPEYERRLELWRGDRKVDFYEWIAPLPNISTHAGASKPYLVLTRDPAMRLEARLVVSFFLSDICESWWGCKSVYRID